MGWGKWIGSILDHQPRYNEYEGRAVFKVWGQEYVIWDGIHYLANLFIPEKKNFYGYSLLALAIRGIYWWAPMFVYAGTALSISWPVVLFWSLIAGISFPLSELLALQWDWKIPIFIHDEHEINRAWQRAELIYGLVIGVVFMLLIN